MNFFQRISGFLFWPHEAALAVSEDERASGRGSWAFAFYLSILIGISMWCFIFYPEPLYFGLSGAALKKEVPSILIADPLVSLAVTAGATLIILFVYTFLVVGAVSHLALRYLSGGKGPSLSGYLECFTWSLTPLLFWAPVMALRIFLFERWIHLRPLYPFFDWTAATILHLAVTGAFIAWKLAIEVRINQALFGVRLWKALVPPLIQCVLLAGLLFLPILFNDLLFNALKDGLT